MKIEGRGNGKSIVAKNISIDGSLEVESMKVQDSVQVSDRVEIDELIAEENLNEILG